MIRIANTQDIPQLKNLLIKLLTHHQQFNLLYKVDVEHQEEIAHFFSDVFANDHYRIYVADIENKLAGFIMCTNHIRPKYFTIKNKGRIDSIYVDSNYRNQNLASKLVEKALDFMKDAHYIELEFTAENQLAKEFWLNKGFQILNHQCILNIK